MKTIPAFTNYCALHGYHRVSVADAIPQSVIIALHRAPVESTITFNPHRVKSEMLA